MPDNNLDVFADFLGDDMLNNDQDAHDPEAHDGISCEAVHPFVARIVEEFFHEQLDPFQEISQGEGQFAVCMVSEFINLIEWSGVELQIPGADTNWIEVATVEYESMKRLMSDLLALGLAFRKRWECMEGVEETPVLKEEIATLVEAAEEASTLLMSNATAEEVDGIRIGLNAALKPFRNRS